MEEKVQTALLLTFLGACGTAMGAFLVVLHPKMQFKRLGLFQVGGDDAEDDESRIFIAICQTFKLSPRVRPQGLAAGLMLSISVFDLFQESAEAVGTGWANVW